MKKKEKPRNSYIDLLLLIAVAVILFLFVCTSCESLCDRVGVEQDGIIEEAVEMLINHETGLEIDLTPTSPERFFLS